MSNPYIAKGVASGDKPFGRPIKRRKGQRSFAFSLRDLRPHIETILAMDLTPCGEPWPAWLTREERDAIKAMHACIRAKLWDLRRLGKI